MVSKVFWYITVADILLFVFISSFFLTNDIKYVILYLINALVFPLSRWADIL
jgi:hypothetical protein